MPLYNPSSGSGVSDGATLSTGLTFPNSGLHILDTNATHDLILSPGSNITADRTLTVVTGDLDRSLTLSGDADISGSNTGDQNVFATIAVSGQSNVVADSANDTLTLVAGSNVTITTSADGDSITIAASGGGGGATTALDNLASVAINQSLTPATDNLYAIGSGTLRWENIYLANAGTGASLGDTLALRARDIDGSSWVSFITLTANNTPTCTMSGVTSSSSFNPTSSDGASLGTTSLMWSDLFLASGAVVNFNNGDVTVTHSSDQLAFAGGSSGYSFDAKVFPASDDGAALGDATHNFSDLFLASGAVVNVANGNAVITHSSGIFTVSTGDLRVTTAGTNTASVVTNGGTQTLTNKRVTKRVQSVTNAATITPNADSDDVVDITAIAQDFTLANPSGTPTNMQLMEICIKDNGTGRAITYGSDYAEHGFTKKATTTASKNLSQLWQWRTANGINKWLLMAQNEDA